MQGRAYDRMDALRRDVAILIDANRIRWTTHALYDHQELSLADKVDIIRWGGKDRVNRDGRGPSYVRWAIHPDHGLCRGVYSVVDTDQGPFVRIITAFKE
jgi:hypothetical protein